MKKKFKWFLGHHEYTVFLIAFITMFLAWIYDLFFPNAGVIPVGGLSKIPFAIIMVSIGGGCSWIWMNILPKWKKEIDPDTPDEKFYFEKLSEWQKILYSILRKLIGFLFYALFFLGFILAARQF
jgi:hypothetical protein